MCFAERALFWLPRAGLSTSVFDTSFVERTLGITTTTRTQRTLERITNRLPLRSD